MKFQLIDAIIDQTSDRIVAVKQVSRAEEYLGDHFPGFPVLPGVMMLEALIQAARHLLGARTVEPLVLGEVKALRYGTMVRPGETLEVEVEVRGDADGGIYACRGTGRVRRAPGLGGDDGNDTPPETAVSGRFTMRPLRNGLR